MDKVLKRPYEGGCEVSGRELSPPLKDSLLFKREQLQAYLNDVNEAITALEENPEVERVLDLIRRTGRF